MNNPHNEPWPLLYFINKVRELGYGVAFPPPIDGSDDWIMRIVDSSGNMVFQNISKGGLSSPEALLPSMANFLKEYGNNET